MELRPNGCLPVKKYREKRQVKAKAPTLTDFVEKISQSGNETAAASGLHEIR
jgi:hypothetical protein